MAVEFVDDSPRGQLHPEWGPEPPVAPVSHSPLSMEVVRPSIVFPVIGDVRFRDDFNEDRGAFRHTGIDVKAKKMSPIVAPISGILGMKKESFWIYGDGWAILGTHLNDDLPGRKDHRADKDWMFAPNIEPGLWVTQGQLIGYVGESGDATAPHLHFEIYAPGDRPTAERVRNPFPALKAAQVLKAPHPADLRPTTRPKPGQIRFDLCIRKFNAAARELTGILVSKTTPDGTTVVVVAPVYRKFKLTEAQLDAIGGIYAIKSRSTSRPIAVFTELKAAPEPIPATALEMEF